VRKSVPLPSSKLLVKLVKVLDNPLWRVQWALR